jgi:AcrR family transcriptional regulator
LVLTCLARRLNGKITVQCAAKVPTEQPQRFLAIYWTDTPVCLITSPMISAQRGRGRPRDAGLVARREKEILAAATRLFAEKGYRQADVQVVADRIGVGKGTVYRYFPTKEALFFGAVDAGMRALVECIDAAANELDDPAKYFEQGIRSYLEFFDRNPHLVELLIIERAEFRDREQATYFVYKERHHARRKAFIEKCIARGIIRDIPAERIMNVVGDCLYGAMFTNHFSNRRIPYERQAADIMDLLMHGVFTQPHVARKSRSNQ